MRASASARSKPRWDTRRSSATSVGQSTTTTSSSPTVSRCTAVRSGMARTTMSSVSSSASARLDHGDADGRVRDGVELQPGLLVGEGHGRQRLAVDGPVGCEDARPEAVDQRLVGGAAGCHHVAGHLVGVDEHRAPFDQQVGHGRLARADAAGQADGQHQPAASRRGARATANRTRVVSSGSSVTNQSSAVMPVTPPVSCRATSR